MGRGKSTSLSLIHDKRKRLQTFEKRRKGLEKKAHELSTLCAVDISMIMFGPDDVAEGTNDPIIWPNDPNVASRIISMYEKKQKSDPHCTRNSNIATILQDRIRLVEKDVEKLRKQNIGDTYPTWHESYDTFSIDELLQFSNELDGVLQVLKSRSGSMQTKQVFQASSSYGDRGEELETYHPFQGLNSFNCFGNVFSKSRSDFMETHEVSRAIPSYGIRGKELENYQALQGLNSANCFSTEGAGAVDSSYTLNTMGESSSYYNNYNNYNNINGIAPVNFDHMITNNNYCCQATTPQFGENLVHYDNNVIMNQPQAQYLWYAPPQVFMPRPLSSVDASRMVQGGIGDQFVGNYNFQF